MNGALDNLIVCFDAVLPSAVMMAVGYLTRRTGLIRGEDIPLFNRVIFRVFMPAMVFYNLIQSDLQTAIRPAALLYVVLGILAEFALAILFALRFVPRREDRGAVIQGLYRSNFAIVGMPIALSLIDGSDFGAVAVMLAVVVPVYNTLAVVTLCVFRGEKPSLREILKGIVTNPLVLGSVAGIAALLVRLRLPAPLMSAVDYLSRCASPMMLFLVGAFFRFEGLGRQRRLLAATCFGRLLLLPGVFLTLGALLGFRGVEFAAMIGVFASANAIASYTMTQQMGGNDELAGNIVVLTNVACPVTLFCWCFLFKQLGVV